MPNLAVLACVALALTTAGCEEFDYKPTPNTAPAPPPPPPKEGSVPAEGKMYVKVWEVKATTKSTTGPYTEFFVSETDSSGTYGDESYRGYFPVYVRSDDNVGALERGSIIGILMGAAETRNWGQGNAIVWIKYSTTSVGIEVEAANMGGEPRDMQQRTQSSARRN